MEACGGGCGGGVSGGGVGCGGRGVVSGGVRVSRKGCMHIKISSTEKLGSNFFNFIIFIVMSLTN